MWIQTYSSLLLALILCSLIHGSVITSDGEEDDGAPQEEVVAGTGLRSVLDSIGRVNADSSSSFFGLLRNALNSLRNVMRLARESTRDAQ